MELNKPRSNIGFITQRPIVRAKVNSGEAQDHKEIDTPDLLTDSSNHIAQINLNQNTTPSSVGSDLAQAGDSRATNTTHSINNINFNSGQSTISEENENNSLITASSNITDSENPEPEPLNLENLNLEQIKMIKDAHMDEKQKFLSAVATFTRSAGEFYKLFQNHSVRNYGLHQNVDSNDNSNKNMEEGDRQREQEEEEYLSNTEKAALEYKKAVGGSNLVATPPAYDVNWGGIF